MHEIDDQTPCRYGDCGAEVTVVLARVPGRSGTPPREELKRACTNPACRSNTGHSRPYERV